MKAFRLIASCAASLLLAAGTAASAHEYYAKNFTMIHPWAEATAPGATEAPVYFKLEGVTAGDRIVRGAATFAQNVELRAGADRAAPAAKDLPVPVADVVEFVPGKAHVLLRGLKAPLQDGRSYLMTLEFEKAGPLLLMISVGAH